MSHTVAIISLMLAVALVPIGALWAHEIGHEHEHVEGGWNSEAGFVSDVDIEARLWNPRGKSSEEILQRAAYLTTFFDGSRTAEERAADAEIRARYPDAIVINMLMPSGVGIQGVGEDDFLRAVNRNRDAGVSLMSVSTWAFEGVNDVSFDDTLERTRKTAEEAGVRSVRTVEEIRAAKAAGEFAMLFNVQGSDFVADDMDKVAWAREQGILIMNFTYNNDNALSGGGQNPENNGVTELGKQFIERANLEGVLIDVSHSSDQAAIEAAKHSTKPIVASHSNVKKLYKQGRNLSDEGIRAIADKEGVICAVGVGIFLNGTGDASVEAIAEHVNYVGDLVGREHTGYASDYSYTYQAFLEGFIDQVDLYPPEKGFGAPTQNSWGGDIWGVAKVLEDKYEWDADDIRGFLGENVLRVFEANWK